MPRNNVARDWHVDRPLTNLSIALTQDSSQFIAAKVGTNIPVSFESDQYTVYPQGTGIVNMILIVPKRGWLTASITKPNRLTIQSVIKRCVSLFQIANVPTQIHSLI